MPGELSSVLQLDKSSAEPLVAHGNGLLQLQPWCEVTARGAAAPRSNPSARPWISLRACKLD